MGCAGALKLWTWTTDACCTHVLRKVCKGGFGSGGIWLLDNLGIK